MSADTAAPVVPDPNAVEPRSRPVRFVVGVLRQTFVEPVRAAPYEPLDSMIEFSNSAYAHDVPSRAIAQ